MPPALPLAIPHTLSPHLHASQFGTHVSVYVVLCPPTRLTHAALPNMAFGSPLHELSDMHISIFELFIPFPMPLVLGP